MKTPRVNDFDPDAKVPTLKSALDNMPAIERPQRTSSHPLPGASATVYRGADRASEEQPLASPTPQPARRPFLRRTFDFYEDQISFLKHESLQQRLAGKEVGMNEMVREALDAWINKRTSDQ
jgi:hypothetical protein